MHFVCVCEQHQNAKLITVVIPGSNDYEDLLEKIFYSMNDRKCMLHLCESDSVEEPIITALTWYPIITFSVIFLSVICLSEFEHAH